MNNSYIAGKIIENYLNNIRNSKLIKRKKFEGI